MAHVKVLASDEFEGRAPGTKGEDLTVAYIADQFRKAGLKPGNTDGTYIQKVPMVGITADPATSLVFRKGDVTPDPRVQGRCGRVDQAGGGARQHRRDRRGVRRLRRPGARVPVGRLQGRRPGGQDRDHARQRSAGARPGGPVAPRPEDVRRPRHDLLRPLDLQVRDGRGEEGRRRLHRARDRAGRVSVLGRPEQGDRAVRSRDGRQEPGPGRHRGLDHPRPGEEALRAGRAGLRRAQEARRDPGVRPGAAGRDGVDDAEQPDPDASIRATSSACSPAATRRSRTST